MPITLRSLGFNEPMIGPRSCGVSAPHVIFCGRMEAFGGCDVSTMCVLSFMSSSILPIKPITNSRRIAFNFSVTQDFPRLYVVKNISTICRHHREVSGSFGSCYAAMVGRCNHLIVFIVAPLFARSRMKSSPVPLYCSHTVDKGYSRN